MSSYQSGLFAEFLARCFLRLRGFRIICSRHVTGRHTKRAEIDIIARRGNLVIFVEVKRRPSVREAFDAIGHAQALRLRRAAETWIALNRWRGDARFDVVAVSGWSVRWFKNAL
jgi:putative endonuclease